MARSCLATISWSRETSSFRGVVFVAASFRNGNGSASNSVMSSKFKNSERTSTSSLARGTAETAEAEDEGRRTTGTAAFETGNMAAILPEVSAGTGVAGATIGTAHGTTALKVHWKKWGWAESVLRLQTWLMDEPWLSSLPVVG